MADNVFNLELELFIVSMFDWGGGCVCRLQTLDDIFLFFSSQIERLSGMANSRYEYVKSYELNDSVMPCTWIVVKIKFSGFNR